MGTQQDAGNKLWLAAPRCHAGREGRKERGMVYYSMGRAGIRSGRVNEGLYADM